MPQPQQSEEDNFFDKLGFVDPEEVRRNEADNKAKYEHAAQLMHRVFVQSEDGAELLEIWKETLIMMPSSEAGMDMLGVGINEGFKQFIRSIILTVKKVDEDE